MEKYSVTIDSKSGIRNDPNKYGDEKYILNLLLSVINVSVKTMDLVNKLPEYQEINIDLIDLKNPIEATDY